MEGTLPKDRTHLGSEIWGVLFVGGRYVPSPIGRVTRLTGDGAWVGKRCWGWQEYPLFLSEAEAAAWAREHVPDAPSIT